MTNPDPQVIWNLAITVANNVCINISNRYNDGDMTQEAAAADKCHQEIMSFIDDDYYINVLMGTEPPEDKGPV